jgi:predicted dehydrogenase
VDLAALEAGGHVWSEKPIALERATGRRVLEAAAAAGRRVAGAPDTFLGPGLQGARRYLESGAIGRPRTALTLLQSPGPESWHPNPDFLFDVGAGPLFDVGPYYVTGLVTLFGPIARVSATADRARDERVIGSGPRAGQSFPVRVATHVAALYEFEGGATATSIFSFDSALRRTQFEVSAPGGVLVVPDPNTFGGDLVVHTAAGEETVALPEPRYGRGAGVLELARAIRAGRPERASGALAFHVLDVMASTLEAAEAGSPIEVESTVDVVPPLPADWDPFARTL